MIKAFPFQVLCAQTDNGFEFTKRFGRSKSANDLTLFENKLKRLNIEHRKIKPFIPRHNGKVERSHRKDNEYFYATHRFYSFKDFYHQLKIYNRKYNLFPMRPLGWKSPKETLLNFFNKNVTYV